MQYTNLHISRIILDNNTNEMNYLKDERLKKLSEIDKQRLIRRDERIISERGTILNNYLFSYNLSLEEYLDFLFIKSNLNKLTFSEQILTIELFKQISMLIKTKEKSITREIDRQGKILETSITNFKDRFKIDCQRDNYDKVLSYWNILNQLEYFYTNKSKSLSREVNYILGLPDDLLIVKISNLIATTNVISFERKLIKSSLKKVKEELNSIKELDVMSEEEKTYLKKLRMEEK